GNPFIEIFLADDLDHAVHLVVAQAAEFRTGELIVADFCRCEVHVNNEARNRILFEAEGWDEETVNDVDGPQPQIDLAIDRHVHDPADQVILGRWIIRVETNGTFIAGGGINQVGLGGAEFTVRTGVAEVPGKLHACDFDRHRAGLGWLKAFGGPDRTAHEIQANKEDGGERRPKHFHLRVPVGIAHLACDAGFAILPHQIPEGALRQYEDHAHGQVGKGELAIDAGSCQRNPLRQPPGFGGKKVGADEGDQPNYQEK